MVHSYRTIRRMRDGTNFTRLRHYDGGIADLPTGPKEAKSTVLSIEEEAIIVAFRRHTLLPLEDCLCALQPTNPEFQGRLTSEALYDAREAQAQ
jgi:hypothetical protein